MAQGNIQSVERAFKILEEISKYNEIGITEISKNLHLNKSTTFGIIKTLENLGYVFQNKDNEKYQLSFRLLSLFNENNADEKLLAFAKPYLQEFSNKYNETVQFVVGTKTEIIYLDKIESSRSIRVYTTIGKTMPMYCTGLGKAILSTRTDEEIDEYLKNTEFKKFTKNTIVDPDILKHELLMSRIRGYAVDDGETQEELSCFAASIVDSFGIGKYAISLSLPNYRKDEHDEEKIAEDLLKTKEKIEKFF